MRAKSCFRQEPPAGQKPPGEDDPWEVFIPDDDQRDPMPEFGDFWTDADAQPEEDFWRTPGGHRRCCL